MLVRTEYALLRARLEAGAAKLLSEDDESVTASNVAEREELLRSQGLGLIVHVLTKPIARRYACFHVYVCVYLDT